MSNQPAYAVYTKPGCPHCDRAKTALTAKSVPFVAKHMETEAEQKALMAKLAPWRTFPAIFALNDTGVATRFVGGADSLIDELKKADSLIDELKKAA